MKERITNEGRLEIYPLMPETAEGEGLDYVAMISARCGNRPNIIFRIPLLPYTKNATDQIKDAIDRCWEWISEQEGRR